MNILIIEDEYLAVQKLTKLLNASSHATHIVGVTDGIESTVEWFKANPSPDLILMDIELADGQSFEIFNLVSIPCPVIFTTSYDESAIRSFRGNSLDYLLKPIKSDELEEALAKFERVAARPVSAMAIDYLLDDLRKQTQPLTYKTQFLAKFGQQMVVVYTSDIAYFYTTNAVTGLYTTDKSSYVVDLTLDELEPLLDPTHFFRVNDQFIIELKSVVHIHYSLSGQLKLDVRPNRQQPVWVDQKRIHKFNEWIGR
ncbi:LytTR family DNA-binding domain-containing protein [Spirosoma sp. SC4-14]|uniref:LytR/AlgR family response regulator transcription factor n=1 Tax=Spirosoma sp. SC4-14 TaxID=3128900 RepID=UPI0030D3859F